MHTHGGKLHGMPVHAVLSHAEKARMGHDHTVHDHVMLTHIMHDHAVRSKIEWELCNGSMPTTAMVAKLVFHVQKAVSWHHIKNLEQHAHFSCSTDTNLTVSCKF
jgi:hypothetical protein